MNLLKSASLLILAAVLAIPIGLWQVIEQSPSALAEAPIINSISPSSGSIDGGDTVTISGSGFSPDAIDKVVTSGSHSCLLVSAQAYCWGSNSNGQLGDGTTENRLAPTAVNNSGVLAGRTVTDIAVGNNHSCAVADGQAYCWGINSSKNLGDGTNTSSSVPVAVSTSGALSGKTVTSIASKGSLTCVIANSQAYCWGSNFYGGVGNGTTSTDSVPVAVSTAGVLSGKTLTDLAVGHTHACAIAGGQVYCWGGNSDGQLGDNSTTNRTTPVAVNTSGVLNGKTVTKIATGSNNSCAIANGQAYCWGDNFNGQLGRGNSGTGTNSSVPLAVSTAGVLSGKTVTDIGIGMHACAVADNQAYCWGVGYYGNLGNGTFGMGTDSPLPVAVSTSGVLNGKTVSQVTAEGVASCVIADGSISCWGSNPIGGGYDSGHLPIDIDKSTTQPEPQVSFGGVSATAVAVVNDNTITAETPAGLAGPVDVKVTKGDNPAYIMPGSYTYIGPAPTISSVSPSTGVGGDSVTITGTNFNGSSDILFGTVPAANIVMVNSTTLTATVPSQAAGVVDVTVENPDGQSASLTNGFTYQVILSPPGPPTSLIATPASGQVDLAWTAPEDDGGATITDYQVEYSEDGLIWQQFSHSPSPATSLAITGLNPGLNYQFRVSAVNSQGVGDPSNIATAGILYISLSAPTTVGIEVTPSGASTVSSSSSLINITTNNPDGYDLTLESSSSNRNLVNGDSNVTPASGNLLTPASLGINTWGYRVDGAGGFGGPTVTESNVSSSGYSWAGVPAMGNPDLIKSVTEAVTDDQTTVWYAMSIDNNHPSGTYTNTVLYTAVAG